MITSTWLHANDCMLATIDTETTGLRAGYHDAIQVAILPLNAELKPSGIDPFNLIFKPDVPKNISKRALEINKITLKELSTALAPESAWFTFEHWFEKNVQGNGFKKILPIGQNVQFDMNMIKEWAGWDEVRDHDYNYSDEFFEWKDMRDTQIAAKYLNDVAWFHHDPFLFHPRSCNFSHTLSTMPSSSHSSKKTFHDTSPR